LISEGVLMKKPVALILILVLVLGAGVGVGAYYLLRSGTAAEPPHGYLQKFKSAGELLSAFKKGTSVNRYQRMDGMAKSAVPTTQSLSESEGTPQHSTTNVQVEGVDEADIVKNDGRFIYAVSGGSVVIALAYPADKARVLSRIPLDKASGINLFINSNRLAVIGTTYVQAEPKTEGGMMPPRGNLTFARVYDISNPEKPGLVRNIQYEGSYSDARMIGGNVHVVLTTNPYYVLYDRKDPGISDIIPRYSDTPGEQADFKLVGDYRDIETVNPKEFTSFLSVLSFPLAGGAESLNKRVIAGYSDNVYASTENLYVASSQYGAFYDFPVMREDAQDKTTIYKFKFDGPKTTYAGSGEVPGTVLNQFSMDEAGSYFRIATTVGHVSREGSKSTNNVYVLGPDMKMAGKLEGLAPGEKIYSARFLGNRAYLVTFKKVDPFFVLDLSDPASPKVLGALKIPGYSDYLHPYDENHVIGIGKNTVEANPEEGGSFAWYQGMKIAIFDVTDVANPKEMHKLEIGDRGTDSYALNDHKAFLFDRAKNLLVLPVLLAELTPEQKAAPDRQAYDYGNFTFQGAYVYDVSLANGIQLKGRITHIDNPAELSNRGYYYYDSNSAVQRSLYIGNSLYTVSQSKIKINDLATLGDQGTINLVGN
jgi:inhibitor of cysteine peptidase